MTRRELIVSESRKWLGTPWIHQARLLGVGVDCIGLVYMAGRAAGLLQGVSLPSDYDRRASGGLLQRMCDAYLEPIAAPRPGSVALMRFTGEPHHTGIIGDYPQGGFSLIHSYAKARKAVEHRLDADWMSRIVAFYDFKGVR